MVWKIYLHMKIWLCGGILNFLGQFLNPLGKNTTFKWLGLFPATGAHSSNLKIDWWNFWAIDCGSLTGCWLNQPMWKLCSSKWVHLPQILGWKYKTYFKPPPSYKSLNLSAQKMGLPDSLIPVGHTEPPVVGVVHGLGDRSVWWFGRYKFPISRVFFTPGKPIDFRPFKRVVSYSPIYGWIPCCNWDP